MDIKNNLFKNQKDLNNWVIRIIFCACGIIFMGLSMGICTRSALGTDPITVFLTGVSYRTNINLGLVINIISLVLLAIVFFIDKKYINIGTLIYVLLLGVSTNLGTNIYNLIISSNDFIFRLIMAIIGSLIGFIGLASYMTADIGIDPWTAIAIIISKKINRKFGVTKMSIDILMLIIGYLLGGEIGIMTLIMAIIGGPTIQKIHEFLVIFREKLIGE